MINLLVAFLKTFFTKGVSQVWENRDHLWLYLRTLFGKYKNKEIRFSISYLFRIKIPESNSYLLVFNRRIENQLQPVGGAYKRHGDNKLFESWGCKGDNYANGLGTDKLSEGDLRFRVKGKYVIKVIKWFEEGKEREISAEREFYEELIVNNILDPNIFRKINYRHIKRISKHLIWSEYHQCYEVLIYDIMELIPDEQQKVQLLELNKRKYDRKRYAIVECDDIEKLRLMKAGKQPVRIGEHSKLIIN